MQPRPTLTLPYLNEKEPDELGKAVNKVKSVAKLPVPIVHAWYDGFRVGKLCEDHRGYVYLIKNAEENDVVKIGYAQRPTVRLTQLQTGNDAELYIYSCFPAHSKWNELWTHRRFTSFRKRGEWFWLQSELLEFVELVRWIETYRPSGVSCIPRYLPQNKGAYNVRFNPPDFVP